MFLSIATRYLCLFVLLLLSPPVFGRSRGRKFFLNVNGFTRERVSQLTDSLRELMVTSCAGGALTVNFHRSGMQALGILSNQLTYLESSCEAVRTEDAYTLRTDRDSCGTTVQSEPNGLQKLRNTVIVAPPSLAVLRAADGPSVEGEPIKLPVVCVLPQVDGVVSSPLWSVELYTIDSYMYPIAEPSSFPKGTSVYTQVEVVGDSKSTVGVMLESCSLVQNRRSSEPIYLIRDRCVGEMGEVNVKPSALGVVRFLFRLTERSGKPYHLQCSVTPCALHANSNLRQCQGQEDYCESGLAISDNQQTIVWPHSLTVTRRNRSKPTAPTSPTRPVVVNTTPSTESSQPAIYQTKPTSSPAQQPCADQSPLVCQCSGQSSSSSQITVLHVILVALGSFALGAALVIAIWCVYYHTDPRRRMQTVSMSDDSSSQESGSSSLKLGKVKEIPTRRSLIGN